MIHSLSQKARNFYFSKRPAGLGSKFVAEELKSPLPGLIVNSGLLSLEKIRSENERLFYIAGMHYLCQSLSQANWLDAEFRTVTRDRVNDLFEMLSCPQFELDEAKKHYGLSLTAATEVVELRRQYANASQRCYYSAYAALRPDAWTSFLNDPDATFAAVKAVLSSDGYKDHWLPTLINKSTMKGAMPLSGEISLISDKLTLLKLAGGKAHELEDVKAIISDLEKAAHSTGLFRGTFIHFLPSVGGSISDVQDILQLILLVIACQDARNLR